MYPAQERESVPRVRLRLSLTAGKLSNLAVEPPGMAAGVHESILTPKNKEKKEKPGEGFSDRRITITFRINVHACCP